jgi:hypothetical protein
LNATTIGSYVFPKFNGHLVSAKQVWNTWCSVLQEHCIHDFSTFVYAQVQEPMRVICQTQEIATLGSSVIFRHTTGKIHRGQLLRLLKLSFNGTPASNAATTAWAIVAPYHEQHIKEKEKDTEKEMRIETDVYGHVLLRLSSRYHIVPARSIIQPFHAVHYCPMDPFCLGTPPTAGMSGNIQRSPNCDPSLFSVNQFRITDPLPASCLINSEFDPVPPLQISLAQAESLAGK